MFGESVTGSAVQSAVLTSQDSVTKQSESLAQVITHRPPVSNEFAGQALRGEYFTFQTAVVAGADLLQDVDVEFEAFSEEGLGFFFEGDGTSLLPIP